MTPRAGTRAGTTPALSTACGCIRRGCLRCSPPTTPTAPNGSQLGRYSGWRSITTGSCGTCSEVPMSETTTRPQRVRVTWRHPGGRKPAGTVYVGRPSRWGNPYPVAEYGRARAVALYRQHLADRPDLVADARRELAGYDLACWCQPGQLCHAAVPLGGVNVRRRG